jgi:hypothetical protein
LTGSYAKETTLNYAGFGILLTGIAVLTLGMSGTAVTLVKGMWSLNKRIESEPRILYGSIWAIGMGAMLLITGSLIAGSYAKTSLMNYSGFGMLLAGTGVFAYGLIGTARFSTMGFLSGAWNISREQSAMLPRMKSFWARTLKTTASINLAGVMVALGLLFFSLWQLDLIVSGPVW